jgi:hypothetical protein
MTLIRERGRPGRTQRPVAYPAVTSVPLLSKRWEAGEVTPSDFYQPIIAATFSTVTYALRENIESRGTNSNRYYCSTYVKGHDICTCPSAGKGSTMNRTVLIILAIIVAIIVLVLIIIGVNNLAPGAGYG